MHPAARVTLDGHSGRFIGPASAGLSFERPALLDWLSPLKVDLLHWPRPKAGLFFCQMVGGDRLEPLVCCPLISAYRSRQQAADERDDDRDDERYTGHSSQDVEKPEPHAATVSSPSARS